MAIACNLHATHGRDLARLLRALADEEPPSSPSAMSNGSGRPLTRFLARGRLVAPGPVSGGERVCGRDVERAGPPLQLGGVTCWFCALGCLVEFASTEPSGNITPDPRRTCVSSRTDDSSSRFDGFPVVSSVSAPDTDTVFKEVVSMMGWYGGGAGWAMMITNSLTALLLVGVVVWAVVRVTAAGQRRSAGGPDDARAILDRRFAGGDIDPDAYRAGVRELTAGRRL